MDFIERLSCITYGKQMLFKEDGGMYYSGYYGRVITQEEAEDWLVGRFYETEVLAEDDCWCGNE